MTLGSIGDFFPFLAIAEGLRRRGHRAVLASNAGYAGLARMAGFEFAALWERADQSLNGMIAQDPAGAWAVVRDEMFLPAMAPAQNCIAHYAREGQWTLLASWTVFGATKEHDRSGLPLLKVYLSPGALESDEERRPDAADLRNIGLFPERFAASAITQTGFALLDDALIPPLPDDLDRFLGTGPPPLIFTPGSFMRDAHAFFREALTACERLGLRAVFLTPYREQIPRDLPACVRHFQYVPLQRLTPRCAAIVHHGGIGTLAQGLKAGIPQLVSPLFFDQPDNARRLEALGVSATLEPESWRHDAVVDKLCAIQSETLKQACTRASAHFVQDDVVARTCDIALSLTR